MEDNSLYFSLLLSSNKNTFANYTKVCCSSVCLHMCILSGVCVCVDIISESVFAWFILCVYCVFSSIFRFLEPSVFVKVVGGDLV